MKEGYFSELTKRALLSPTNQQIMRTTKKQIKKDPLSYAGLAAATGAGTVAGAAITHKTLNKVIPDYKGLQQAADMISGLSDAKHVRVKFSKTRFFGKMIPTAIGGLLGAILASKAYTAAMMPSRRKIIEARKSKRANKKVFHSASSSISRRHLRSSNI